MNEFRVLRQFCRSLTTSLFCQMLFLLPWVMPMLGQSQTMTANVADIPHLIRFSGTVKDAGGNPRAGVVGITFALYKEEQGGSPLWLETQNVRPDAKGNYTVQLGANSSEGIPLELFASGEARWLGVRVDGGGEQARVLLLSVPYALKAGDAATVGGLPASAFVLAAPGSGSFASPSGTSPGSANQPNVGGSGTQNYIPLWTDNSGDLGNSILYQTGSGSSAKIGINLKNPLFTVDVNGQELVRGLFEMATQNYANQNKGYSSQPFNMESSAFNSSTNKYTLNHFQWQAEPVGNNTSNPGATLNLLYGTDPASPTETGLLLNSKGIFTFVSGQTFPGTGTVTSVGSGAGLTGGPITGSGTLSIAAGGVTNSMLQNPSLTVTANSPLSGGGTVSLGGSTSLGLTNSCASGQILKWNGSSWACAADNNSGGTVTSVGSGLGLKGGPITGSGTLSIDTTVVPQLAAANFFSQTNNISVTGSFQDGLDIFDAGSGFGLSVLSGYNGIQSQGGAFPISGIAGTFEGIFGDSDNDTDLIPGIFGFESGTTHRTLGVLGNSQSTTGAGVYGQIGSGTSGTGSISGGAGVWGDGGGNLDAIGVLATTDNNAAMLVENNSGSYYTFVTFALSSAGYPFRALNGAGNGCYIDSAGSINCTGSKNALVSIDGGQRKVALSAIESPKNWFEDFGSEQLSNGAAVIHLEPEFAQTVNTEVEYHVFLTPNGDCNGLYVTEKSASSFEVHELHGGTSAVKFDYRIVALRKNFENIRMADHTNDPDPMKSVKHLPPAHVDIPKLIPATKIASVMRPVQQHANTKAR